MLEINNFIERKDEILALLKRLVEIESPSDDKAAVDRCADLLEVELVQLGGRVTRHRQPVHGDHLVSEWGQDEQQKGILFLCHMDTVHPLGTLAKMPLVEREGRLHGPGVEDMKAGIAMLLTAVKLLREKQAWPRRPITALFNSDEETGSETSRDLIERLARRSALVLCLEPGMPDGSLKTWRKGVGDFEVTTHGRASHAGSDPQVGRNAIEEMAHQILAIQSMTDYEKGTTLNVGVVNGGTRPNVVPAEAHAQVDLRVMDPGEAERVTRQLLSLQPVMEGTTVTVTGSLNRPPMPRCTHGANISKSAGYRRPAWPVADRRGHGRRLGRQFCRSAGGAGAGWIGRPRGWGSFRERTHYPVQSCRADCPAGSFVDRMVRLDP